jgi:hypothetical protein
MNSTSWEKKRYGGISPKWGLYLALTSEAEITSWGLKDTHTDVHSLFSCMEQNRLAKGKQTLTTQNPNPSDCGSWRHVTATVGTPRDPIHASSNHLHSIKVFRVGGKSIWCPKFLRLNVLKSLFLTSNFSRDTATCICHGRGVPSRHSDHLSSQSAGICQNVLCLINMYNASSRILC